MKIYQNPDIQEFVMPVELGFSLTTDSNPGDMKYEDGGDAW